MIIKEMIGKTFKSVSQHDSETLIFKSDDLEVKFFHDSDCCESVSINQVDGEYSDLVDSPILMAEYETNKDNPPENHDCFTWTFYKFATTKGYVTVRWLGESNGSYSETVAVGINGVTNYLYGE